MLCTFGVRCRGVQLYSFILVTLKKASAAASSGYWLGPPLICPCSSYLFCHHAHARLRPAAAGSRRVGGRSGSQPSLHLASTCPRPFRRARALKRARYGVAALGLPSRSRASSCPCSDQPTALSARACCAGVAAKAPTQRAARRNRRRMWCLGLRLDAQGGGRGGGGGGGGGSYLCSTPSSSCDGVECVFAFPEGAALRRRAIGRVSAHRLNAAVVSNAAPTGTVARFPRRRPHVTQLSGTVYSRTRLYTIKQAS